jgi:hypothetical protein
MPQQTKKLVKKPAASKAKGLPKVSNVADQIVAFVEMHINFDDVAWFVKRYNELRKDNCMRVWWMFAETLSKNNVPPEIINLLLPNVALVSFDDDVPMPTLDLIKSRAKKLSSASLSFLVGDAVYERFQKNLSDIRSKLDKITKKMDKLPDGPFDKIAFADERHGLGGIEPDNKTERLVVRQLRTHFANSKGITPGTASMLQAMLKNGEYKDFIAAPKNRVVFRGMRVPKAWVAKAIGEKAMYSIPLHKRAAFEKKFTFTPKRPVASWTSSIATAREFSQGSTDYSVVLHAAVDENPNKFIDCKRGFYDSTIADNYNDENEVIGIGQIKVFKLEIVFSPSFRLTLKKK